MVVSENSCMPWLIHIGHYIAFKIRRVLCLRCSHVRSPRRSCTHLPHSSMTFPRCALLTLTCSLWERGLAMVGPEGDDSPSKGRQRQGEEGSISAPRSQRPSWLCFFSRRMSWHIHLPSFPHRLSPKRSSASI